MVIWDYKALIKLDCKKYLKNYILLDCARFNLIKISANKIIWNLNNNLSLKISWNTTTMELTLCPDFSVKYNPLFIYVYGQWTNCMCILEKTLRAKLFFFCYKCCLDENIKILFSAAKKKVYERIFIFIGAWIINFLPLLHSCLCLEFSRRITRISYHSHISLFCSFFWWKGLQSHICYFIGQVRKKWSKTSYKNLWYFKTFSLSIFSCWFSSNILKTWHWDNGIIVPVKRVNMG